MFALFQMFIALLCTGLIEGQWPGLLWLILICGMLGTAVFLIIARWFENRMPAFLKRIKIVRDVVSGFNALLSNCKVCFRGDAPDTNFLVGADGGYGAIENPFFDEDKAPDK
jgi:hypothetical protein